MSDKPLTDITFSSFDLHPSLLAGLEAAGFSRCTPIQALTLPIALTGRDVAGQAQTGTGKTLAFLVTVVNRLLTRPALAERKPEDPRALILAPTRELAIQIHKDAVKFGSDLGLKFALVYGGVDYDKQRELLQKGADVIIATPGRLIDYVKQHKVVSLHACEMCVLDEADRMFDLGFIKDIRFLLRRMPIRTERQTLLFSATFEAQIKQLALEFMRSPQQVQIASNSIVADAITHRVHPVDGGRKRDLLIQILASRPNDQVIVFGRTKHGCNRLSEQLEEAGLKSVAIHGNKSQAQRQKALRDFKANKARVLVATDVAARGLDRPSLPLVINFDLPMVAEDYVHRIGRTGRNGLTGEALSLVSPDEGGLLRQIQRILKDDIEMVTVAGFEPSRPIRMGSDAPGARRPGAPGGNNRGNNAPRKPAHRPHGKPAPRHAHAGPKQHRGGGAGAGAGAQQGQRRDRSAG
ncbi:DEAD/DEAH box helicase [Lysobacter sp. 2RAB21]